MPSLKRHSGKIAFFALAREMRFYPEPSVTLNQEQAFLPKVILGSGFIFFGALASLGERKCPRMTALLGILLLSTPAHASFTPIDPPQKIPPLIFEDRGGKQHAVSDYKGEYVLLNIWASWCGPCVREMPSLDRLQQQANPQKLRVVTLSEDRDAEDVPIFYHRHNLTHLPVAIDSAGTAPTALHLTGLPTTLLIDPQGFEIARVEGEADWTAPDMLRYLQLQTGAIPNKEGAKKIK